MPWQSTFGKEIPRDSDMVVVSDEEVAAERAELAAERFAPTPLARALEPWARMAKSALADRLGEQTPLAVLSIQRQLLAQPTERAVPAQGDSTGWGVPRQLSRLSLILEDVEYILRVVDESADPKRGMRQVTAAILSPVEGTARFTIDDRAGLLAGTLRSAERTYRIVSIDRDAQAVYRLADVASGATQFLSRSDDAARAVEKRHVQLEVLAQIAPDRVRMARNDLSVTIDGGALGSIDTQAVTSQSVLHALQGLQPLTNATGTEKLRILSAEAGRIRYVQVINGIPVLRQNELTLGPLGEIRQLKSSLVDATWAPSGALIPEHRASKLARQALAQRAGVPGNSLAEAAPSTLWYHVDGPNRTLSVSECQAHLRCVRPTMPVWR